MIRFWSGMALAVTCAGVLAQEVLPKIDVTAPKWVTKRGGYEISSDFQVDPRMSAVVYPAEAFQKDDVLDVKVTGMKSDEYFVLQECIALDCTQGHIMRVWNAYGVMGANYNQEQHVWIPHEGKFFLWMQRFPMAGGGTFTGYDPISPPLVLNPTGTAEQFRECDVKAAQERGPLKVASSDHNGTSFVIRYEGGTSVLVQRMRPAQ